MALWAAFFYAVPLSSPAASSDELRLAYFQTTNIFHSGLRGTHTLALTFDDGPGARTLKLLRVLKENGVSGTFFIVGKMADLHPDILKDIVADGHLLANHTASHIRLDERYRDNPDLLLNEIRSVDDQIRPLMPPTAKLFFRAPYGVWRAENADALNADPVLKRYIGPIYWDIGGSMAFDEDGDLSAAADWQCWREGWEVAECAEAYLREIREKDGGVVLMHCVQEKSVELLESLLPVLREEGYDFVRLDEVPAYRKFESAPDAGTVAVAQLPPP